MAWGIISLIQTGKFSSVVVASGAIAGLVAITPAAGHVGVLSSLAIGALAGILCYLAVQIRAKTTVDDALEVFAIHGVGGIWGALATGIFASAAIGSGVEGAIYGNIKQLGIQAAGVGATIGYSFVVSFLILKILDFIPGLGLRVTNPFEDEGLDVSLHGERAYVGDGAD